MASHLVEINSLGHDQYSFLMRKNTTENTPEYIILNSGEWMSEQVHICMNVYMYEYTGSICKMEFQ